ncbi:MAG TPA: protein-disulfide reductase DsbD domain-containing protein [Nevskiaceae bacterium]
MTGLRVLLCAALCAGAPLAGAADFTWSGPSGGAALLPAEQAFAMQPVTWANGRLRLDWNVAPGYYLYRDRIKVDIPGDPPGAGRLELPPAQPHKDEFFGETHIYRGHLAVRYVPPAGQFPRTVEVTVQGCADRGVCYPPLTRTVAVQQTSSIPAGR